MARKWRVSDAQVTRKVSRCPLAVRLSARLRVTYASLTRHLHFTYASLTLRLRSLMLHVCFTGASRVFYLWFPYLTLHLHFTYDSLTLHLHFAYASLQTDTPAAAVGTYLANLNTVFKSSRGSGMRRRNTRHRHCKKVRRPVFSLTPLVAVTPLPARAVLHCEAETAIVAAARCLVPSPAIIIRRYVCLSAVDVEVCQRHVAAVGPKLRTGRGGGGGRN